MRTRSGSRLRLDLLESREVPTVAVQLDFTYDTSGLFTDAARRAVLQQAVNDVAVHLDAALPLLASDGGNTWSATFVSPSTGQQVVVDNPTIAANALVLYVGGQPIGGSEAGFGGPGGYSASGTHSWLDSLAARGPGGKLLWGGSLTFDTRTNWFFGSAVAGIGANQADFYSVAVHEFGHVLGIGTSPQWFAQSRNGAFAGANADALYGGPVPLAADGEHWADGVTVGGQAVSLDPILNTGRRVIASPLDFAALEDIGWSVAGVAGVAPGGATALPAVPFTPPPLGPPGSTPVVLTGATDGSASAYYLAADYSLTAAGKPMYPFPGFTGVIRSVVADFNGDGIADYAFATGTGVSGSVRIFNGRTGANLVAPTAVFDGFSGGLFIAAGDVDRDGKAELAVSADTGGGPRVTLFRIRNGALAAAVDFIAFEDADFRGGTRIALADVNGDGAADLIVGAGVGGGPRVSIYNGAALLAGRAARLIPDFFALDSSLRSGVYVTAADLDGDGYADIVYSTGNTGGPRIRVVSGALLLAKPGADVASLTAMADFFALDSHDRNGIRIAARDLNGDGKAELIVGGGSRTSALVRVIPLSQANVPTTPLQNPFSGPLTIDGVYVG